MESPGWLARMVQSPVTIRVTVVPDTLQIPGVVELKHFFLAPEVRGRGLGRVLLGGVEEVARGLGARRIVLDTAAPLTEAAALYLTAGYAPIARYNDNPHGSAWFGRDL